MSVKRVISKYDKVNGELLEEVDISSVDVIRLKLLFSPPIHDPDMFNPYEISEIKSIGLSDILIMYIDKFDYFLECYQA